MILDPMSACFLSFSSPELRCAKAPCGCHSWFSLQLHFYALVLPCTADAPGTHKVHLSGFSPSGPQTFSGIPSVCPSSQVHWQSHSSGLLHGPAYQNLVNKILGKQLEGDILGKLRASCENKTSLLSPPSF